MATDERLKSEYCNQLKQRLLAITDLYLYHMRATGRGTHRHVRACINLRNQLGGHTDAKEIARTYYAVHPTRRVV